MTQPRVPFTPLPPPPALPASLRVPLPPPAHPWPQPNAPQPNLAPARVTVGERPT